MLVKVIAGGASCTYQCMHVAVTNLPDPGQPDRSKAETVGIEIELGPSGPTICLPEDGDAAYIMNDAGDTVDSYRWPPKSAKGKEGTQ
jgi:hypothetical protein